MSSPVVIAVGISAGPPWPVSSACGPRAVALVLWPCHAGRLVGL